MFEQGTLHTRYSHLTKLYKHKTNQTAFQHYYKDKYCLNINWIRIDIVKAWEWWLKVERSRVIYQDDLSLLSLKHWIYRRAYRLWTNTSKRQQSDERLTSTVNCKVTMDKATSQLTWLPFVQNPLNKCILTEHLAPVKIMPTSSSFGVDD